MKTMLRAATAAILIGGLSLPAQADEIEDALQIALEAYRAGDINIAKEEIDYAAQLIAQLKAVGLSAFLPDALPGWTRVESEDKTQTAALMGGGMTTSASYTRGDDGIDIRLMADNQMVTAMAAMFGNAAMMGSMGKVKRIKRQKVVITRQGELQAMINNRILIRVTGRAPIEDKEAYFAAIDLRGLKEF